MNWTITQNFGSWRKDEKATVKPKCKQKHILFQYNNRSLLSIPPAPSYSPPNCTFPELHRQIQCIHRKTKLPLMPETEKLEQQSEIRINDDNSVNICHPKGIFCLRHKNRQHTTSRWLTHNKRTTFVCRRKKSEHERNTDLNLTPSSNFCRRLHWVVRDIFQPLRPPGEGPGSGTPSQKTYY